MSSSAGSTTRSARHGTPVTRAALVTHGRPGQVGDGARAPRGRRAERRRRAARPRGGGGAATAWSRTATRSRPISWSCSAATGRCFARSARFLGTGVPVIGVNFGRVGFLSSMQPERARGRPRRVRSRASYDVVELPTLEVENGEAAHVAVNDVVVTSARRSAGWSSSSGRSAARTSAASRATGSSARRRRARPPTTSRTAARC